MTFTNVSVLVSKALICERVSLMFYFTFTLTKSMILNAYNERFSECTRGGIHNMVSSWPRCRHMMCEWMLACKPSWTHTHTHTHHERIYTAWQYAYMWISMQHFDIQLTENCCSRWILQNFFLDIFKCYFIWLVLIYKYHTMHTFMG